MAKKKVAPPPTIDELKANAIARLTEWDRTPKSLIPVPTREFEVGEEAIVGALKDVVILEELEGGYAYLYSCTWTERDNTNVPRLFSPYKLHPCSNSDLSSVLHHILNGGLVCDPRYQRGYVWTDANKDALIESIFDRLDIGSFLFVRHAGFNHKDDESIRTYRTLDGRSVDVKRCEDYTVAIIDGQQRLTTITDFMLGRRAYKGVYFSQMNPRDQIEFEQASVAFRIVEEEKVSEKDIVRMFLQSNRGVPQSPEHIAKVQAMYESM